MKAALISLGSVSSKGVAKAMKKYFDEVDEIDLKGIEMTLTSKELEILYKSKPMKEYDCIFARGSYKYEPLLRSITVALFDTTYMPIQPASFSLGHDKLLTQLELQKHKIPMPKTYLAATPEAGKAVLEEVNYPIIMKFPSGTGGKGVMYAESFAAAASILDALTALNQPFLIQEYIETDGVDTRVIVAGDKVIAAMKRKAKSGEKRANVHSGGEGQSCVLDAHTKKIAIETTKITGAEICAVDILEGIKGPMVIEVNLSPGLQGITKATKIDVADKMAKYLYKRTKELTDKGKKKEASNILDDLDLIRADKLKEIITPLDFRGNRILLPELVTNVGKFDDNDEVIINIDKGNLCMKKSDIGTGKKKDDD
jgi:ribosomal protein S6--L-glutamate ligase